MVGVDALQLQREVSAFRGVLIVEDDEATADIGEDGSADFQKIEVVPAEWAVTSEVLHVEQQGELGVAAAQPGRVAGGDVPQLLVVGEAGESVAGCAFANDGESVGDGE